MASLLWEQLKAMYKKDWLIRKRHWIVTIFELFLPILMVGIHLYSLPDKSNQMPMSSLPSRKSEYNSPMVQQLSKHSDEYFYYDNTFYCYSYGKLFYYSPTGNISDFLSPAVSECGLRTVAEQSEYDVIKDWGDSIDNIYTTSPALFIHELDLDKGIANYTIGTGRLVYRGPWSDSSFTPSYQSYVSPQSILNILLASYPNGENLTHDSFSYHYTNKLFDEGDPSSEQNYANNKNGDPTPDPGKTPDAVDFYQAYTFLEVGFLYVSTIIARRIIQEKATNSKELLRIMGLSDVIYWISHFINYLSLSIFHASAITILYSISKKNPYPGWNGGVFWFNYSFLSVANILFTFTFSTILTRPIIGVLIVIVGRAGLSYLAFDAKTDNFNLLWISPKVWSCLLPEGQLHYSTYDMFYFGKTKKVSFSDLFSSFDVADSVSFRSVYLTAIIAWLAYLVFLWYLDAVWPWQTGTPKPWYFPVSRFIRKSTNNETLDDMAPSYNLDEINANADKNEAEPSDLKTNIQCTNLYKAFGSMGNKKFAVNGLDMNIYKGQITALLGHNGAGKTTTMSMITGLLPPTSGKILVHGIDVHQDTAAARRCIALCPQSDLLFEELTVTENLELVTGLRGLSPQTKKDIIPLNIKRVNLTDKANTLASNLSGGMRRRLQLALALTTSSETLILDEPTSGLDPESRRQLWNLLLELRKDLSILLTTHFMEEADALGDRIIIMASGKIKCSGSSMFLKRQFGAGNSIRIAKDTWSFELNRLDTQIRFHFPNAFVTSESSEEVIYQLSLDSDGSDKKSTSSLISLCDYLDNNLSTLGITSYGISVTTLEDVFLKVAEEDNEKRQTNIQMEDRLFEINKILDYTKLTGFALTLQRLRGLVMKRVHYIKRHYKTIGFTIILPVLVILLTFMATRNVKSYIIDSFDDYPYPIDLNLKSIYGENAKAVIRASSNKSDPFIEGYRTIMKEAGIEIVEIPSSLSMDDYMKTSKQTGEQFMRENIIGIIEDPKRLKGYTIWYNPKASISLPLSVDAWTNTLIRISDEARSMSKVVTTYLPMPNRAGEQPQILSMASRIMTALFSPIAFSFIAVSYFLFPSTESANKANLIQKMSGIKAPIFWCSHIIFDFSYHIIVSIMMILGITIIDRFIFTSNEVFFSVFILMLLYGLASIPLFYLFSFLPIEPARGFSLLVTISLIGTLIGSGLAAILVASDQIKSLHVFLGDLFPPFAMSFGLSKVYSQVTLIKGCRKYNACDPGNLLSRPICCDKNSEYKKYEPFAWKNDGVLPEIAILCLDSVLYILILILLDTNLHRFNYWYDSIRKRLSSSPQSQGEVEDDDVTSEKYRVAQLITSGRVNTEALTVSELSKDFGSFRAVDKISFAVHKAECFGLLGVNGAGKTTTFRMLTGDLMVTQGDAFVESYSLRKDLLNFQQSISYCPQFDALLDKLTPLETLTLFARIRGMPENKVKENVNYIITSTDLTQFTKTCNENLSGGNKRKLSLAIAAIAKPKVMFLDEPTTGVDPASRRKIWSTLMHLRDTSGSSIVLTSHSMDECEALCSRIGIMARGNFKCLGSAQHLKQKFGQGYTLVIKINQEALKKDGEVERIQRFIQEKFPSAILRDFHQTILHYHVKNASARWGEMLRALEQGKSSLMIEDFTLTGTTLEQIFLSFAKES
ncbi:ATP-binding cassette sub-family A member 1 [Tetranychus urticae]|uniref:ABC transporter domain-containing protein n=1 Tax=Tetranychus urticae TaxID=32264 RepID=T1KHN5_TETUR|nr:ATP-binding cassette sub-family A member 1 [Tetranychus urticae]XP_015786741.1 ATP-binding cassette sub-family A member 1 [Tetranychus urticae]XP_025017009.1 ATP-binding cassette sub-family A member 1 [Tetranychus urticae]